MVGNDEPRWEDVILRLLQELHRVGTNAPRIEAFFGAFCRSKGLEGVLFATPTGLFAAFGPLGQQRVGFLRETPSDIDLGRLIALQALAQDAVDSIQDPREVLVRLESLGAKRAVYSKPILLLSFGAVAAAASVFFTATWPEVGIIFSLGLLVGLLAIWTERSRFITRLFVPLSAFLVAALAAAAARHIPEVSFATVTVCSLIVVLPGLTLTTAIKELAGGHLASGSGRFFAAATTLALLAVGIAAGSRIFPPELIADPRASPTILASLLAATIAGFALCVLYNAPRRELWSITAAAWIAILTLNFFRTETSPAATAFLSALSVGIAGNLHSRWRRVPAAIMQTPGTILLVPGSIGLRSVLALLGDDVSQGISAAFTAITTAGALASGLVVANLLAPGRPLDEHE